jgi:hypothetical protein
VQYNSLSIDGNRLFLLHMIKCMQNKYKPNLHNSILLPQTSYPVILEFYCSVLRFKSLEHKLCQVYYRTQTTITTIRLTYSHILLFNHTEISILHSIIILLEDHISSSTILHNLSRYLCIHYNYPVNTLNRIILFYPIEQKYPQIPNACYPYL